MPSYPQGEIPRALSESHKKLISTEKTKKYVCLCGAKGGTGAFSLRIRRRDQKPGGFKQIFDSKNEALFIGQNFIFIAWSGKITKIQVYNFYGLYTLPTPITPQIWIMRARNAWFLKSARREIFAHFSWFWTSMSGMPFFAQKAYSGNWSWIQWNIQISACLGN